MDKSTLGILLLLLILSYVTRQTSYYSRISIDIKNIRFLLWSYPISSRDPLKQKRIPTCPYQWPNGQGDIAKFLEGEKNSNTWFKEYGSVYRIWNGTNSEVVLTDPDDIKTVFKDSNAHLKASNNNAGWLMGQLLGKCLGLVSGTEWQQISISTKSAFARGNITALVPRISSLTERYFEDLISEGSLNQGILNPGQDLRLLPFWIVADYLYGEITPDIRRQLLELIPLRESLFKRVIQGGLTRFAWSRHLPTSTNADLAKFKSEWRAINDAIYQSSRLKGQNAPIVRFYDHAKSGSIDFDHVLQTLDEMLFANLDVTIGAMSWNPLFLAAHQDVQEEVRNEIKTAKADHDEHRQWNKYLSSSETLLAASILEAARLKPLAAFSVPQAAPTDREVGGYVVPAGTSFVVDTHALNIRNPYWGSDSANYRPARFLGRNASDMRYHYWRFGFGPRQCIGKHLAELIIRTAVVHLVENYRLQLVSDNNWEKAPHVWITQANTNIRCESLKAR